MHTLVAYGASIVNGTVYGQVAGVADGSMTRDSSNNYIMPANMQAIAAFAMQANLQAAQIQAPSLRNIAYPEIYPTQVSAVASLPTMPAVDVYDQNGPRFVQNESVGIYVSVGGAAAAVAHAALWLTDRYVPATQGMITTLVATTSNTTVVQSWTLSTLSFTTQLAAGEYAVVGMGVVGADANFARLLFPGGSNFRPGCLVDQAYGNKSWRDQFRMGRFGDWGKFVFNAPPQIELFGHTAATATYTVYLDVVKTR